MKDIIKADSQDYNRIIQFINKVFKDNFKTLIPKLYHKRPHNATHHNIIENEGKMIATAGNFPLDLVVDNCKLKVMGIGMVAVKKSERGKGFMDKLIKKAVQDAQDNNADFMFLGGNRQRYDRYGFTPCLSAYNFSLCADNIAHFYKENDYYSFTKINNNCCYLNELYSLYCNQNVYYSREKADFVDTLKTWRFTPYCVFNKGILIGYIVYKSGKVHEIVVREEKITDILIGFCKYLKKPSITVVVPLYKTDYIMELSHICGEFSKVKNESVLVINYKNVIETMLSFKIKNSLISDNSIVIDIENVERIEISTCGGKVLVSSSEKDPNMTITRDELQLAMFFDTQLVNHSHSYFREIFPLPLSCIEVDTL